MVLVTPPPSYQPNVTPVLLQVWNANMLKDDLIGSMELPLDMKSLSYETSVRSRLLLEAPAGASFVAGKIECSIGLHNEMPHVRSLPQIEQ